MDNTPIEYVSLELVRAIVHGLSEYYTRGDILPTYMSQDFNLSIPDLRSLYENIDTEHLYKLVNIYMSLGIGLLPSVIIGAIIVGMTIGYSKGINDTEKLYNQLPPESKE